MHRYYRGLLATSAALLLSGCATPTVTAPHTILSQFASSNVATNSSPPASSAGIQFEVGQQALNSAVTEINHAHLSIDLDMYELTNHQILSALESAHRRGVTERVILDASSQRAASELEQHGISVHVEHVPHGIDHVKFLEIDRHVVLLGSVNFGQDSGENEDASAWFPATAATESFFSSAWANHDSSESGPLLYNQMNTQHEATHLISTAKKSVVVGMFAWTDYTTQYAVIDAAHRGVSVTVYIDGHQSENRKTIDRLKGAGVHVVTANTHQWLHLKCLIVDGQTTLFGSSNWSYSGFHHNRELDILTTSPSIASGLTELLQQTQ